MNIFKDIAIDLLEIPLFREPLIISTRAITITMLIIVIIMLWILFKKNQIFQ